ncbi:MAG: glutamate--cysteine ligase [Gammaproteobacteria bacterium]|nr:MAG: glutamate--cysteine ligase [Gammaproteobacteria bacterium]
MYSLSEQRLSELLSSGRQHTIQEGLTGLEKESLRVGPDGSIAQTPHPAALGSALTHPWITTDYSEALLEFITPPLASPDEALAFLRSLQQFVYLKLNPELLWSSSMPCVVEGGASIPIAQYGSSNAGLMKTVYRRGLGYRYGRVMQVIAGGHYNYSFADAFWPVLQEIEKDKQPLQDYRSARYFHMIRNLQRFGWLVPYLYGSSPAICKSYMNGEATTLEEFNENSYYAPYATSLRMGDIGYQNAHELKDGFKATYDSLDSYTESLMRAIETPCPSHEKIGVKVNGEYRQLNANILQIENEYYSSVRPKQVPEFNEKPTLALQRRGVRYVELRSLDINPYEPTGISVEQCRFLETMMAFCLLHESPVISDQERLEIDFNLNAVCYRGREPDLVLQRNNRSITLKQWAGELSAAMTGFAGLLDAGSGKDLYGQALLAARNCVSDPERTPSARVLADMRAHGEGYFHFAKRMSEQHREYFRKLERNEKTLQMIEASVEKSIQEQQRIEISDTLSFDEFLEDYFSQQL